MEKTQFNRDFYERAAVERFHSFTPLLPVRQLENREDSHVKRQGMLDGKHEFNSQGRVMWTLLKLHETPKRYIKRKNFDH